MQSRKSLFNTTVFAGSQTGCRFETATRSLPNIYICTEITMGTWDVVVKQNM